MEWTCGTGTVGSWKQQIANESKTTHPFSFSLRARPQMAFVVVFGQELIQGKGVVQGVSEGDPINLVAAGLVAVTVVGLTGFLALKGEDDYVTRDME
jgi:hypothetical protein